MALSKINIGGFLVNVRAMPTVALNEFTFKQPVRVGDILSFFSEVTRLGRISVTVKAEVYAERFKSQGNYITVTEVSVTCVAIDE